MQLSSRLAKNMISGQLDADSLLLEVQVCTITNHAIAGQVVRAVARGGVSQVNHASSRIFAVPDLFFIRICC